MTQDKMLIKKLLDALVLAEGIACHVIRHTSFDESNVSDWRPRVRSIVAEATQRLEQPD